MGSPAIRLGVNIDHCATLRQARYAALPSDAPGSEPDPVEFACSVAKAGADGITVHLREDRRHIQERDVWRVRGRVALPLNLELACTPAMIAFALKLKPDAVCLVPENRREITTEGGLDVHSHRDRIQACIEAMRAAGIQTSLFIDPDARQIDLSAELGAPCIELHTGAYANAAISDLQRVEFRRLQSGARRAHDCGLIVNAGHGINYRNITEVRMLPFLHELNIGHSIVCRALLCGVEQAVREMKTLMGPGSARADQGAVGTDPFADRPVAS